MESFLIFLDFDGVLHDAYGNLPVFAHVPALADALARFQDARIVITSSWREHRNLWSTFRVIL